MNTLSLSFPGGRHHALTLSYDDGVDDDIRLIDIMKQHGLKGTFNLNSALMPQSVVEAPRRRLTLSEAVALYDGVMAEVAVHGAYHPRWTTLPIGACQADITLDRLNLEKAFGRLVRGAAYPYGANSDMTVDCLRTAGIAYCRATTSTKYFDLPTDWLRMGTTCHHKDPALFTLADRFFNDPMSRYPRPRLFYLWGHSYEFSEDNNWDLIERFAEKMGGKSEVWYATNIEIYDYVQAYSQLQFSADMSMVFNPTALPLYFTLEGKPFEIKPLETLILR